MEPDKTDYDLIIAGAGCAGLSLLMRMIKSGVCLDKSILLVDRDIKRRNDRTWCYWEREPGFFDEIVYGQWKELQFLTHGFSVQSDTGHYTYKMIRGIDFYEYCLQEISRHSNIKFLNADIGKMRGNGDKAELHADGKLYRADWIFSSLPQEPKPIPKKIIQLIQHFKGWIIETQKPIFNPLQAVLMDFRTVQDHPACFFYIIPFSERSALVEYTVISDKLLQSREYDSALREYIKVILKVEHYEVIEEEFGAIPMTNLSFEFSGHGIIPIGTAGGCTRASSGYTFQFIQKQTEEILNQMLAGQQPKAMRRTFKYRIYDSILLDVLANGRLPGSALFENLFRKNSLIDIMDFLDDQSSLLQDFRIISSLPRTPFLKAAFARAF